MAKPPSSSVLLLELEDLKENMTSVQAEVDRCLASLMVQSQEVCEVLTRLETLTAIVRAEQEVDRNKWIEEEISFPEPALERFVDSNFKACFAAESMESLGAFREIAGSQSITQIDKSDMNYRNYECISTNDQLYKPKILKNKVIFVKELAAVFNEAVEDSKDASETAVEENYEISDKFGSNTASLDSIPPSTRPSLSRKCRKNVEDIKDPEYFNDDATIVTTASSSATLATKSVPFQNSKMSSPSNVSTGQTSSSMKMSTTCMVNRVKDICREYGWKVEGSYSTREGKEGCGVVHFYKLEVKGGVTELMTRGVGEFKVEAVGSAFKTMENKLIGVDSELWEKVDSVQLKKEDGVCDINVDFPDEELLLKVESKSSSDTFLSSPTLVHSKDRVALDILGEKAAKYITKRVKKTLTVSYNDVALIIGNRGTNINRITKQTGVDITVRRDLVKGRQDRLVEVLGEKASVNKALEMIKKTLNAKENLTTLTVSDHDAGFIIGTQGTNINRITKQTGVYISVRDLVKGRQDRLVEVWGEKNSVEKALQMIKGNQALEKMKENLLTLTVSDKEAGAIIGTTGTNISRIIKETGVNITVKGLVNGRQGRLVEVWGQQISVDEALKMIKEIIQK